MVQVLCLKSTKSILDTVSTETDSDLVSEQHTIFPYDFDSNALPGRYRCTDCLQVRFLLSRVSMVQNIDAQGAPATGVATARTPASCGYAGALQICE
jgi:hypothetical protein